MPPSQIAQQLIDATIIGIIRADGPAGLLEAVTAVKAGGVRAVEITLNTPGALGVLSALHARHGETLLLGVGTCLDVETAREAIARGARYIISPVLDPAVIDAAHAGGAAAIPGVMTPTEAWNAHVAGADLIKLFPASVLGPAGLARVRAPLPQLPFLVTGGITPTNVGDWLGVGAKALGVGSTLFHGPSIATGDFAEIQRRSAAFVQAVARAESP